MHRNTSNRCILSIIIQFLLKSKDKITGTNDEMVDRYLILLNDILLLKHKNQLVFRSTFTQPSRSICNQNMSITFNKEKY